MLSLGRASAVVVFVALLGWRLRLVLPRRSVLVNISNAAAVLVVSSWSLVLSMFISLAVSVRWWVGCIVRYSWELEYEDGDCGLLSGIAARITSSSP